MALRRLLCIALIQSSFYYAYSAWNPILTKKLKYRTTQNKYMCFYLQLEIN